MENKISALGLASMICGILSLVLCCCLGWVGCALGGVAILLFILERAVAKTKSGMGVAGLVCGIITVVLFIITMFASILLLEFMPEELISEMNSMLDTSITL